MEEIRLQKYFTECKVLSRRAAEKEIADGKVTVNGQVASLGDKVLPGVDLVEWNGTTLSLSETPKTYIILNKPIGYVTTLSDEKGRKNVTELTADVGERIYPIGRLDMYSEGLLLLTNDGELTNRLTHPRHEIPKIYSVKIVGEIPKEIYCKLAAPMEIDGYKLRRVGVKFISYKDGYTNLQLTLFEGRNRQIRKMCEKAGLTIARLTRIAIGELRLGDLPRGKWRHLTEEEVAYLMERNNQNADRETHSE